jgi:hypothetical protein
MNTVLPYSLYTNNTAVLFATHSNWLHAVTEQIDATNGIELD